MTDLAYNLRRLASYVPFWHQETLRSDEISTLDLIEIQRDTPLEVFSELYTSLRRQGKVISEFYEIRSELTKYLSQDLMVLPPAGLWRTLRSKTRWLEVTDLNLIRHFLARLLQLKAWMEQLRALAQLSHSYALLMPSNQPDFSSLYEITWPPESQKRIKKRNHKPKKKQNQAPWVTQRRGFHGYHK